MKYKPSQIISALLFVVVPCCCAFAQATRIAFREPLPAVRDSIVAINSLMDKVVDSDDKNYFFDDRGFLYINNKKMGRMLKGDNIDLGLMAVQTDLSKRECKRFLALSAFLQRNFINGCIRHQRYEVYFYIYQPAGTKAKDNFQYIVSYDERLVNMTGTDEAESFTVLDRRENLLLLLPSAGKK